jgi:hypothetical protein
MGTYFFVNPIIIVYTIVIVEPIIFVIPGYYSYWHCCSYCYCYSLALPSPGWITLLLMMLWFRADHPGLRKTGTAPEGSSATGLGYFRGLHALSTPPGNAPMPSPNQYFTPEALPPRPYPGFLLCSILAPCTSCSWTSDPGLSILCLAH